MSYCLYYFTGTLNTERIAQSFQKELGKDGLLYRVGYPNQDFPDPRNFDLIGIGYPIHAFNTPWAFLQFLKQFPRAQGKRYFIFKVSGEPIHMNDASSAAILSLLGKKGYRCIQEFHYLMPYNIVFRHSDGMAKKMWLTSERMVSHNAERLKNGIEDKLKRHPFIYLLSLPYRIEWPFAKTNGRHFKVDLRKCSKCLRCIRSCPMQNITYEEGKFHFGNRCTLCLNCSFYCPRNAITPGLFRHGWKLNGSYHLESLANDPSVKMPNEFHEKLYNRAYRKYYARCEALLAKR
jgi:ferredoxin